LPRSSAPPKRFSTVEVDITHRVAGLVSAQTDFTDVTDDFALKILPKTPITEARADTNSQYYAVRRQIRRKLWDNSGV
jgi:hypothetical protein